MEIFAAGLSVFAFDRFDRAPTVNMFATLKAAKVGRRTTAYFIVGLYLGYIFFCDEYVLCSTSLQKCNSA